MMRGASKSFPPDISVEENRTRDGPGILFEQQKISQHFGPSCIPICDSNYRPEAILRLFKVADPDKSRREPEECAKRTHARRKVT